MTVRTNTPDANHDVRILVASDDRSGRETLRDLISSWGFVGRAVARDQLLEEAQSFAPQVLLLDLTSQQKDSDALLPELQARGIEAAIVVMAEEADFRSVERTIKRGSPDFISKPINPNNLRVLLSELAKPIGVDLVGNRIWRDRLRLDDTRSAGGGNRRHEGDDRQELWGQPDHHASGAGRSGQGLPGV